MVSGLIIGILFGFLWKRGKFCATGIIRDVYLEKTPHNMVLILSIIFIQAFIYYIMVAVGLVPEGVFKKFSILSVGLGSFMFGFGAVMSNGCITASLVKIGDGRVTGYVSLIAFVLSAYFAKHGFLSGVTKSLNEIAVVENPMPFSGNHIIPVIITGIIACVLLFFLIKSIKAYNPEYSLPAKYTGFLHFAIEKVWIKDIVVILMGIVMALGFYFSNLNGRNGGLGITTPLLSWFSFITGTSDKVPGWAAFMVLGIVIGSFLASFITKEFSFLGTDAKSVGNTILGSILMGVGAIFASGCLIGNGLVGTAQLSIKAWIAFLFIVIGIWTSAYIFIARDLNKIN
ncbi:MAG: YeeE/YedE family protein [Treponema sp.]